MPFGSGGHERDEHAGLQVVAIEQHQRLVGNVVPQRSCVAALVGAIGPEGRCGHLVRAQRHEGYEPHEWIAAGALLATSLVPSRIMAAEVRTFFDAVRDSKRRAIDAVQREAAPPIMVGAGTS